MDDGHIADGREILEQVHLDLVGGAVDDAGVPGDPERDVRRDDPYGIKKRPMAFKAYETN